MEKIPIGISSCLLGEKVRFDASHQRDPFIVDTLGRYFEWVPVCPEVEYGLGVPREPLRLVRGEEGVRLVTSRTGRDHTEGMKRWTAKRLDELEEAGLCGFIFKARSPSSGLGGVRVYPEGGGAPSKTGRGVFGGAFTERFPLVPAEDDGRLHDPALRENFIERVFTIRRWREFFSSVGGRGGLVAFHTAHKLLVMAHSPKHYRELGRLVAGAGRKPPGEDYESYITVLTEAMKLPATARKNADVLHHMAGYFKKLITADERQELAGVIDDYRRGLVPLVVPVTLIRHYTRKFDEPYLKGQVYLNPHPAELMLRNHV